MWKYPQLVDDHADLFRELLHTERLRSMHLAPLYGHPNLGDWVVKAAVALDAGYSANEIVDAAFGRSWSWDGSESAMWGQWLKAFDGLRTHPDTRIRQVGEIGRSAAAERIERAQERERDERSRGP